MITRPLGASIADWLGKPRSANGLALGDGTVSLVALLIFIVLVAYVAVTKRDIQAPEHADARGTISSSAAMLVE